MKLNLSSSFEFQILLSERVEFECFNTISSRCTLKLALITNEALELLALLIHEYFAFSAHDHMIQITRL